MTARKPSIDTYRPNGARSRGTVGLLAEILRDVPRLDGAACSLEHARLFDVPHQGGPGGRQRARQRRVIAERLCATCPAHDACADWATGEPASNRGAYLPTPRPRKATA